MCSIQHIYQVISRLLFICSLCFNNIYKPKLQALYVMPRPPLLQAYYRNLAEEKFPPIVTRSAATINAFKNDAPWVLIQDFDVRNFDHRPTMDENIPAEKRSLDEGTISTENLISSSQESCSLPLWLNRGSNRFEGLIPTARCHAKKGRIL